MFAVHEGAAAQQRRLEMMRRVERQTSQHHPDDNDEEFARTYNEFVSQQLHRPPRVAEKKSQREQENPEYYEYRGFKVNLTRFLHGTAQKTSRPLARMELHTAIDKIIKLKKRDARCKQGC